MKLFTRMTAGVAAIVFAGVALSLPDVSAYCTARTIAAARASHVAAVQPSAGAAHALTVSSHAQASRRVRLPI